MLNIYVNNKLIAYSNQSIKVNGTSNFRMVHFIADNDTAPHSTWLIDSDGEEADLAVLEVCRLNLILVGTAIILGIVELDNNVIFTNVLQLCTEGG